MELRAILIVAATFTLTYALWGEPVEPPPPPIVIHPLEPVIPDPRSEWIYRHPEGK